MIPKPRACIRPVNASCRPSPGTHRTAPQDVCWRRDGDPSVSTTAIVQNPPVLTLLRIAVFGQGFIEGRGVALKRGPLPEGHVGPLLDGRVVPLVKDAVPFLRRRSVFGQILLRPKVSELASIKLHVIVLLCLVPGPPLRSAQWQGG